MLVDATWKFFCKYAALLPSPALAVASVLEVPTGRLTNAPAATGVVQPV